MNTYTHVCHNCGAEKIIVNWERTDGEIWVCDDCDHAANRAVNEAKARDDVKYSAPPTPIGMIAQRDYLPRYDGLRAWRAKHGLTQAELGKLLGADANTVARWERGEVAIAHPEMLELALSSLSARLEQPTRNRKKIK